MLLELSHWFMEMSLREGLLLVLGQVLWGRDFGKVEGVLLLDKLLVLLGIGGRPCFDALTTTVPEIPGDGAGPKSSDGANKGQGVRGRLDVMYADTTDRSTLLSTLLPVSTSVSSAPTRASTLSRKGGTREEVRESEWFP